MRLTINMGDQMTINPLFTVHPSCLNYPEDLTDQIYAQPWQCINCKTCFICNKAGDDVSPRCIKLYCVY